MKIRSLIVMTCLCVVCGASSGHTSALKAQEYFREGYMASMSRQWDSAIELYTKSIELDPTNAETYLQRAAAFEMADKINEAVIDYQKTLEMKPNYYLAMEYLAKLYVDQGRYSQAINLYSRALTLIDDPKWRSVLKWWISEAKRKMQPDGRSIERR